MRPTVTEASTQTWPRCSRFTATTVAVRPALRTSVRTSTGPISGARRNWAETASGSPPAVWAAARVITASRKPPWGLGPTVHSAGSVAVKVPSPSERTALDFVKVMSGWPATGEKRSRWRAVLQVAA
jgi:hypothetical protein